MASIQVRKDRKKPYRVFWSDTLTGKPRNKSFVRRKEAQAFMESIRASENTLAQADPNKTVADALDRWYSLCATTGRGGREPVERSTSRKYDSHRDIIKAFIGMVKIAELNQQACEAFRDTLLSEYSRPYAKKIFTSFKSALTQAKDDKAIPSNPGVGRLHPHIEAPKERQQGDDSRPSGSPSAHGDDRPPQAFRQPAD